MSCDQLSLNVRKQAKTKNPPVSDGDTKDR